MIDEWRDLEAPAKPVKASEPVTFGVVKLGRSGALRATVSVAEGVMVDIGWPRYRVAWNRDRKAFRITAHPGGPFEGFHPPRGPKVKPDAAGGGASDLPQDPAARRPRRGGGAGRRRLRGRSRRQVADAAGAEPVLGEEAVRVR